MRTFFKSLPFALLALLVFSTWTSAVLSVQDFSCNGGLPNVQLGVPFNCVAVILNDDLQTDATLSSVTLSSLNGWTASTSYAGAFSGNSVPRGSTLSVTFSGIVASAPGSGKKFSDLLINGGSGNAAKLADATLNALSIKTTSVSTSSSTASLSSEFDVSVSLNLAGSANLTAEIALSGCTLSSGQAASQRFGIVSDSIQSTSWKVTQSSSSGSSCAITVEFRAVADPVTLTEIKTASVAGSGSAPAGSNNPSGTTGNPGSVSPGGSTSAGTPGVATGGGGGASSRSNELFPIFGLPAQFDSVTPGRPSTTRVTISSFYTGFLRYVNLTLSGIPQDWYTLDAPVVVGPISNTTFDIQWHVPADARGTYPVVLTISGVGTKNAGILQSSYSFELVLPPADNEQGQSGVPVQSVPRSASAQPPWIPPISSADATNFSIVGFAVFLGVVLLAVHYHFTHRHAGDEQSNPLPAADSGVRENQVEGKPVKSRKKNKPRKNPHP
ncbi:hypothetical protein HYV43_04030 [Candidatus Micrarchaeota archaeon]|nr:hypothetical protein [Candidatus Micrarchaeota archaeon]